MITKKLSNKINGTKIVPLKNQYDASKYMHVVRNKLWGE